MSKNRWEMTMEEQIKNASIAYIYTLSRTDITGRYSVYLNNKDDLSKPLTLLWPSEAEINGKGKLLFGMKRNKRKNEKYPAFHFVFKGGGMSLMNEVKMVLKRINPEIQVLRIDGFEPSVAF